MEFLDWVLLGGGFFYVIYSMIGLTRDVINKLSSIEESRSRQVDVVIKKLKIIEEAVEKIRDEILYHKSLLSR
ncbi:MAG: hypothetical protein KGZ58_14120 [Ignavibacteriales bacterium]|nr:hypothetical protein [Ignavibacteriales bacterium]